MQHSRAIELLPELETGVLRPEEESELYEHAESCPQCHSWLDTYSLFSEALADPQVAHPSSEQLARRALGSDRLPEPERLSLDEHLDGCGECRRELALTEAALAHGRGEGSVTRLDAWRRVTTSSPMRWAAAAGILLALTLAFTMRPLQTERELVGDRLAGVQVVEAKTSIRAESVSVDSGDITFRAGESVSFSEGFSVGQGATFKVEVANSETDNAPGATTPRDRNSKTS